MSAKVTLLAYQRHDPVTLIPVAHALGRAGVPYRAVVIENGNRHVFKAAGIACEKGVRFDVVPGTVVVMSSDLMGRQHELGRLMVDIHRKNGARSISVQHASYLLYEDDPKCHFAADVCCVGGVADYEHYRRLGYDYSRLRLTGMPKYDAYVPATGGSGLGILVANVGHEANRSIHQGFVDGLRDLGHFVCVREHPTERLLRESGSDRVGEDLVAGWTTNPLVPLVEDLKVCRAVVTTSPSVAFEAMAFGLPAAYLDMSWSRSSMLNSLIGFGLTCCGKPWKVGDVRFKQPNIPKEALGGLSYMWDGNSADRVVRVIKEALL